MNLKKPDSVTTAKEALIAELLGDVQHLMARLETLTVEVGRADTSGRETAQALAGATKEYRDQVDASVNRLRSELGTVILKSTESAALTLVTQQTKVLQASAQQAFREVLGSESQKRMRSDWLRLAAASGASGGLVAVVLLWLLRH